nr:hypothetical protein [Tanacetum cinerariifolium]
MSDDVDISALTIEQYLALIKDNNRPGIVKPKIGNDVEFEINSNFMREIRRKFFVGTNDEDAHEHVRRLLEIVDLFHFPGVTHDVVMLRVFPITLKGHALRCPHHDLNCQQKVYIFYTGLDISTHKMLDSRGFITLMIPTQALISIQVMADHSHNWYDETTTKKKINDNPDNVNAIQESFKEAHPTKECPLKKGDMTTVLTDTSEKVKARTTMGKERVKEPVPRNLLVVQNYAPPTLEDEGDMDVGWDIIVEDVERIRQFITPTIHTLPHLEPVVQPYMSLRRVHDKETVRIIWPDDDYVAPATSPTLDMQLKEFGKECSDITWVAKMEYFNHVKDIKELSDIIKTSDFETFIHKLLHQISQSSYETSKIKREMKSHH